MTTKVFKPFNALLFAAALLVAGCGGKTLESTTEYSYDVKPPLEGMDVPAGKFMIDAEKGDTVQTSTGSKITIPANAFVNSKGEAVTGQVALSFREFHTAADIILSGIPMFYEENGEKYNFESAGMFDISGTDEKGEKVFVAAGKTLNVDLASFVEGDDFNFYQLSNKQTESLALSSTEPKIMTAYFFAGDNEDVEADKEKKGWKMLAAKVKAIKNNKKADALTDDVAVEPVEPIKADKDKFVFNFKVNLKKFPELEKMKGVLWQYAGNGGADNPESKANEWVFSENWKDVSLESAQDDNKSVYTLKLDGKGKSFQTLVTPVFSGRDYEKAMGDFEKQAAVYKTKLDQRKTMETEAGLLRSFSINNFGIYNWDKAHTYQNAIACNANFGLKGDATADLSQASIYHISGESGTAVIKYPQSAWSQFTYSQSLPNKLIAILPGNKIATFSQNEFNNLEHNSIQKQEFTFSLMDAGNVKQMNNLMDIVKSL